MHLLLRPPTLGGGATVLRHVCCLRFFIILPKSVIIDLVRFLGDWLGWGAVRRWVGESVSQRYLCVSAGSDEVVVFEFWWSEVAVYCLAVPGGDVIQIRGLRCREGGGLWVW